MAPAIVLVSSYPPRLCGMGTFCEEAREVLQAVTPDGEVLVISHSDGAGPGVLPLIDLRRPDWWRPVVETVGWPVVVHRYHEAYRRAREASEGQRPVMLPLDFGPLQQRDGVE